MDKYNHKKIEQKWQKYWEKEKLYKTKDISTSSGQNKPKYYVLDMFPYPSGEGLHVGHPKGYIATDILARMKMMQGYNVLHPMGWDAFGLPAENYAIKNKIHPRKAVEKNIKKFKSQLEKIGFTYDWSREINTTDPEFYKITQWMFLQMFKKGLAYESNEPVNWCPSCKTVLANEDLENGKCERCGSKIEKKPLRQWVLKITDYADKLLKGLDDLDWEDSIKEMQGNWIGKSVGATVKFQVISKNKNVLKNNSMSEYGQNLSRNSAELTRNYAEPQTTKSELLYENLTYKIRGIIFNVKKNIGLGHKESVYHNALKIEFAKHGLFFESEKQIDIKYEGKKIGTYQPDFVIENKVLIELKALPKIGRQQLNQAWTYLKGSDYKLAFLVNFGTADLEIKRMIYDIARNQNNNSAESAFSLRESATSLEVFTTRPDTLFGCTYMVVSPEHELIKKLSKFCHSELDSESQKNKNKIPDQVRDDALPIRNLEEVEKYIKKAKNKSDLERTDLAKEKTGVELKGIKAINPVNNEEIPIWVADYVLASYGTGAIMSVPAHDKRDFEFAKKYNLPIKQVTRSSEKKCLIIHGSPKKDMSRDSDYVPENIKHWLGWLKNELDKKGYKIHNPQMPMPWKPDYNKWKRQIKKINIDENTTIVGHSAGGAFAVRWLSENKKKIDKLILVAAGLQKEEGNERLHKLYDFKIDKKIRNRVNDIIIFVSNDRDYRVQNSKIYSKELNGRLMYLENRKHFTIKDNPANKEFPELLDEILRQDLKEAFTGDGVNINSGFLDGLKTAEAKNKITEWLEKNKIGKKAINYKLRDWVFSRQRYWGEPIPIIHCKKCGAVAVPEKYLPVKLPEVKNYKPTGTGESPLANIKNWVNVKCPKCGGPAKRETNTMPQWAGSSWYYLAYLIRKQEAKNKKQEYILNKKKINHWMPVDFYVGGAEHATRHLIYARFWHKFLYDIKVVGSKEPFKKLKHVGLILAEDGRKMSKRWGNVINPEDIVKKYGADNLRVYEMFMGPFSQPVEWNTNGLIGTRRFLEKVYKLRMKANNKANGTNANEQLEILLHQTIKKVTEDIESFDFNTAISQLMILTNTMEKEKTISITSYRLLIILLSPFAPHTAEELWEKLGNKKSIFLQPWPKHNPEFIKEKEIELVIQINGKVRDKIKVSADISENEAKKIALESEKIKKWTKGEKIKKIIFVKDRLVNIAI